MPRLVVQNLGASERGSRMRQAVLILAVALVAIVAMTELGAPIALRALVFLPLFAAALQLAQAYSGVCIFHAAKGTRNTGGEIEPMIDPRQRSLVRARGREVVVTATVLSASATVLVLAVAYFG